VAVSAHELHAIREADEREAFAAMVRDSGISVGELASRLPADLRPRLANLIADWHAGQVAAADAKRRNALAWVVKS
jgi:hypothetical protein